MSLMLLIPLIPIAALVTQNMIILNNIIERKADLIESDLSVLKSDEQVGLCNSILYTFTFYFYFLTKGKAGQCAAAGEKCLTDADLPFWN